MQKNPTLYIELEAFLEFRKNTDKYKLAFFINKLLRCKRNEIQIWTNADKPSAESGWTAAHVGLIIISYMLNKSTWVHWYSKLEQVSFKLQTDSSQLYTLKKIWEI